MPDNYNNISIILVEPQMGENIGAAARAMKNFGITDLRLVQPRDGWPNDKAQSMSVGAIDIIQKSKIYSTAHEAISDLEYVYAATAMPRDMNKHYVFSRDLVADISTTKKIGIMFGRESSGLTNKEIALANKIITIDTDIDFSSLNIAHSVAVICYEIFQGRRQLRPDLQNIQELASKDSLESFYKHLFQELESNGFFKTVDKREKMSVKIRNIFARIDNLSIRELQTLRGIINILSKD